MPMPKIMHLFFFQKHRISAQVYLQVDTDVKEPLFMPNYTFQEDCGNWQAVQTDTIIPACFDEGFRGSGLGLCVKNFTPLLPAAIFKGTFLTVKLLTQIAKVLKLDLPKKGEGSGKTGNVVKIDYAKALIGHYFENASETEKKRMLESIMGTTKLIDPSILQVLSHLDPENAEDSMFLKMKKMAQEELEQCLVQHGRAEKEKEVDEKVRLEKEKEEQKRSAKAKEIGERKCRKQEEAARLWNLTPKELRDFLPGGGSIENTFSIEYHPVKEYFRVKYPSPSDCNFDFMLLFQ